MLLDAIVTARGGSKRVPRKNIRLLGKLPLISHTLRAARASKSISRLFVTTDDEEIAGVATSEGGIVIQRPPEMATDVSPSEDALFHALSVIEERYGAADSFCLLQPTSPFRTCYHIDSAVETLKLSGCDTIVSVKRAPLHLNKLIVADGGLARPFFSPLMFQATQSTTGLYLPNGAIYITNVKNFFLSRNLYFGKLTLYEMDEMSSLDIDTPTDFLIAEAFLSSGCGST